MTSRPDGAAPRYPVRMLGLAILLMTAAVVLCVTAVTTLWYALRHPPRKTYAVALARGQPTEPEAVGLTGETAVFTLSDHTNTPAWLVRGEDPNGPTILILHGFGDSRYGALTWAPLLTPHASRLVVFDQRGQGESDAPTSTLGTREVDDVLAVMNQLAAPVQQTNELHDATTDEALKTAAKDGRRIVLFGYSMGAGVAIGAAARSGERVAGVIADGPYRFWHEPVRAELRRRRYPAEPVLSLARGMLWLIDPAIRAFDRTEHARRLRCPLLVLHGTDDEACAIASARAIADAAPLGELVTFEGGHHLDLATHDPARYRDALARFFARINASEHESG